MKYQYLIEQIDCIRQEIVAGRLSSLDLDIRIKKLLPLLKFKESSKVRFEAAFALGETYEEKVVPFLIKAIKDGSPWVRQSIAKSLGQIGDVCGVKALTILMADKRACVRAEAAQSLGYMEDEKKASLIRKFLRKGVNDPHVLVSRASIEALGIVGNKRDLPLLIEKLESEIPLLRATSAEAMGYLGDHNIISVLESALLNERSQQVKINIYCALYDLGESQYLEMLLDMPYFSSSYLREVLIERLFERIDQGNHESISKYVTQLLKREDNQEIINLIIKIKHWNQGKVLKFNK